jgi:hypothetical protein
VYSRYPQLSVDFINGYLAPLSLMMDMVTQEAGFTYWFEEIGPDATSQTLRESVAGLLAASLRRDNEGSFRQRNPQYRRSEEQIAELLEHHFSLAPLANWREQLPPQLVSWLGKTVLESAGRLVSNWTLQSVAEDFVQVLDQFFADPQAECWVIEGDIAEELVYHWGGCGWDDFFFIARGRFYQLHFDFSD